MDEADRGTLVRMTAAHASLGKIVHTAAIIGASTRNPISMRWLDSSEPCKAGRRINDLIESS
jgi:hypothetical protein